MAELGPLSEIVCVREESFVISGHTGDIVRGGDQGVYVRDTRFLDRMELQVGAAAPRHLSSASIGGHRAVFHGFLPPSVDTAIDPTVSVIRRRIVHGGVRDEIDLTNAGTEAVTVDVRLRVGTDFAYIFDVKHGRVLDPVVPIADGDAIVLRRDGGAEETRVSMTGATGDGDTLTCPLTLAPRQSRTVTVEVAATDVYGRAATAEPVPVRVTAQGDSEPSASPAIRCSDSRFARLVRRSVQDLQSLGLPDPLDPEVRFAAAGSPWFLTLFGRDSIWAALMALPIDPGLARGTLFTLARRQGTRVDETTEEQPGKILHEVRRGALAERGDLPAWYYGTIDATPLFVVLAHEAWSWGAISDADLEALMPHVEAALGWMRDHADPDGDGFLEYVAHGDRSLTNQGWKDSHDGVRYADGAIAQAPIALCEVQGYAFDAAMRGAALLDHGGGAGGGYWRQWAAALRGAFRDRFWVEDARGPYPAIALDRDKRPVDGVASNMGHLLASGLLDPDEAAHVAARLVSSDMASGWGLRTVSTEHHAYNPLSYHCGSVWPHDTAIAAWGLATTGHAAEAAVLLRGLVRAAPAFGYRLPELLSGFPSQTGPQPVPFPTACRPQAWAAGGALLLARAVVGMQADVPHGRLTLSPMSPSPFDRLALTNLPLAGGTVNITIRHGRVAVEIHDAAIDVMVEHR